MEGLRMEIVGDEENGQDIRTTYNDYCDHAFLGILKWNTETLQLFVDTEERLIYPYASSFAGTERRRVKVPVFGMSVRHEN